MKIEVHHRCNDYNSYRSARVKSLFNLENGCDWQHVAELPDVSENWQIGLIVGPSGSGKTSLGAKIFSDGIYDLYNNWPLDKPIIDAIAPNSDFDKVTKSFVSVGLGDVPAWLRPFNVLSNGEKFRAGLARLICESPTNVVVDEFTSVIDRQVAKVGAAAFAKSWRKGTGKIVLLSCHYDIVEWLQPDWVYDTKEARLSRDCLRQRPKITLDIYKVSGKYWRYFQPHHYLKLPYPVCASYYVGCVNGEPICHVAVSPFFQCQGYRAMRLVVLPEWQGVGIGTSFLNEVCRLHKMGKGRCSKEYPTYFNTSHPQLCNSLRRQAKWIQRSATLYGSNKNKTVDRLVKAKQNPKGVYGGHFRAIQGFKYVG
ncbi:GNAT family N-acetyltransferase [Bacteroides nordii]|uniref:GNAT family N-acetyltransferase n=1 Tax=Bacteroides nordii TaxID=291645 RepID=UPI0018AB7CA7|nr:GNAT family N-acetyltransferase [Bacteroides nordii]